jgi:hypothetical protein
VSRAGVALAVGAEQLAVELGRFVEIGDLDPGCTVGVPDDSSPACCPDGCPGCGGTSSLPLACKSAPINNDAGTPSCLDSPAPCVRPNPTCNGGVSDGGFCCPSSCAQCGPDAGVGCRTTDAGSCADRPAPCKLVDDDCDYGVVGEEIADAGPEGGVPTYGRKVCCQPGCAQCGGSGCGSCCIGTILADWGPSCNNQMATCIMPN